jgi:hypothetical protein
MGTDTTELVNGSQTTDKCAIFDGDMTGKLNAVCKNDLVSDFAVMSNMDKSHYQAIGSDFGLSRRHCSPMKAREFTYNRRIPDMEPCFFTCIFQVLRIRSNHGGVIDATPITYDRVFLYNCMVTNPRAVANGNMRTDGDEGFDNNPPTDGRRRIDLS